MAMNSGTLQVHEECFLGTGLGMAQASSSFFQSRGRTALGPSQWVNCHPPFRMHCGRPARVTGPAFAIAGERVVTGKVKAMRVPSFEVRNQRSIRLARCEAVPPLMVVAGPNGSGKSTLLNSIRSQVGYTNVVYVGPHRAMRKQVVQQRHLMTQTLSYEALLSSQNVSGMEGIRIFDAAEILGLSVASRSGAESCEPIPCSRP